MKTTKLFFMAALALMTAACSNDDNDFAQQPTNGEITITATLDANDGATTRALSIDGDNIASTWETTDEFAILFNDGTNNVKRIATVSSINGSNVTITFTIPESLANNTACTIVYPASAANAANTGADVATALGTQDGTIGNCPEVRVGTATIDKSTHSLSDVTKLAAQNAIFKFTVTNSDGSATINAKLLSITVGSQDYDITPASPTSELYVALPNISGQEVSFFATSGTGSTIQNYTCSKASVTFSAGKYYQSTLKMPTVAPTNVPFTNENRKNFFQPDGTTDYFRCELYNPWYTSSFAIDPANIQIKKYRKLNVTFHLTGFTFSQPAKMVLCCNRGSEQSWEPGCFSYSRAISVNGNGSYTVSWVNDTGSTVNWNDGSSALTMTMQYNNYASLTHTSESDLWAACEITSITID